MTVVNPKSISGINSITMASGSDNLLTIHSNNTTERFRIDSSGNVKVGTAATISPDGDLFVTGISTFGGDVQVPDKIIHSGDTNTAIRFPAADTITAETGGSERIRIDSSGRLLLGTGAVSLPKGTGGGSFDLDGGSITMCVGGNINSTGRTNSTDKINRITSPHYTNAEEPVALISSYNVSGNNSIAYGGGSSLTNAATVHSFYTAADTTTTTGTERLKITSAGLVNIGGVAVSQSRTVNIGSNSEANLAIETHNDATSETANIRFYKSGNTGASPQVVETDDNIAQLVAYGYDGTDYANAAASIKMSVDGAPGGNDMPGKIIFSTNAGGTSPTERLRITNNGTASHYGGSSWASATTNGDFAITVSNLTDNGGNNWRKCGVYVQYSGINADATSSKSAVGYYGIGSVTTWNWFATGEDDVFTADTLAATLDNSTATSFRLNFNVADNNTGSVTVFVNGYSTKPVISIAG